MEVVPVLVAFSLLLGAAGVAMFLYSVRQRDHEHADRLSLLPLEDDLPPAEARGAAADPAPAQPSRELPTE